MLSIMNEMVVQIRFNSNDSDEHKSNGENHIPIKGHEDAEAFLEALENLHTDAGVKMEELMQTIYELGMEKGKKLERSKHLVAYESFSTPSLRMRR